MKHRVGIIILLLLILVISCILASLLVSRERDTFIGMGSSSSGREYLDGVDSIYWINLDRDTVRRPKMEKMFADPAFVGIPIERVSAVDGKDPDVVSTYSTKYNNIDLSVLNPTEYACSLSHIKAIEEFYNSHYENAIIMEDDMSLAYKQYWKKSVREIINNAPDDWDIIMLCYGTNVGIPKEDYTYNIVKDNSYWSAGAYLVNRKGAKSLINKLYQHGKLTFPPNMSHHADQFIFQMVNTYVYKYPYFIYHYGETSLLHQSHVEYHDKIKRQLTMELYGGM